MSGPFSGLKIQFAIKFGNMKLDSFVEVKSFKLDKHIESKPFLSCGISLYGGNVE
jgi:hypothetical protein